MDEIHEQQKPGPRITYTRIRQTKDFTYSVWKCGSCGEHITTDNLAQHAAQAHNTYLLVQIGG